MKTSVLFITPSLTKGGAETQLVKVARSLVANNYKVMIISLKPIEQFKLDSEKEGFTLILLKNWTRNSLSNLITLWKTVKEFKPQVVIAFMFIAIIFARLLKLLFKFKLISTIRISIIKHKWYLPFRLTSFLDDSIIYNSKASKAIFERKNLVKKSGAVIYNGISLPAFEFSEQEIAEKPFVWTCIGHFKYNKDYQTLFEAMALLKNEKVRLDIVGNLYEQKWPNELIDNLKLNDNVRLLGFKANAVEYLKEADAFVLSSHSEGMPNAILEAMANNKPIVATNIDGNRELVTESGCGFLTRISDATDLASKMRKIMKMQPSQRFSLGCNGRKFIEENFAEEKVMNEWLSLINQYTSDAKAFAGTSL